MAKYLEPQVLTQLDEYRRKIFELRQEAYALTGIDVLDNDTLSALSIYEIVRQYDPDYNINFARNGEDAKSLDVDIVMKASRIERKKRSGLYGLAGFQFHAMGNIEYDRYILVTRDKATLSLILSDDLVIIDMTIMDRIDLNIVYDGHHVLLSDACIIAPFGRPVNQKGLYALTTSTPSIVLFVAVNVCNRASGSWITSCFILA